MRAIDFEYDNRYLSDYGFIICDFNFGSGANEIDAGSTITFNKISRHSGKNIVYQVRNMMNASPHLLTFVKTLIFMTQKIWKFQMMNIEILCAGLIVESF